MFDPVSALIVSGVLISLFVVGVGCYAWGHARGDASGHSRGGRDMKIEMLLENKREERTRKLFADIAAASQRGLNAPSVADADFRNVQ